MKYAKFDLKNGDLEEWNEFYSDTAKFTGKNGFIIPRPMPFKSSVKAGELFDLANGKVIIECGSGLHCRQSGKSAVIWNRTNAEEVHCVDLDEKMLNDVDEYFIEYEIDADKIHTHQEDCIQFLKDFDKGIDLLFLDFWQETPEGRASAYLECYNVTKDKMTENGMILIDDTDHSHPWKQTLIVPEAIKDGYKVLWTGRQTMLVKQ